MSVLKLLYYFTLAGMTGVCYQEQSHKQVNIMQIKSLKIIYTNGMMSPGEIFSHLSKENKGGVA